MSSGDIAAVHAVVVCAHRAHPGAALLTAG